VSKGRRARAKRTEPAEPEAADRPGRAGRPASRAKAAKPGSVKRRIGIRELRQYASTYVDMAEMGYTVDITNRGRLVAQLVPVREPGSAMERLMAAGIVEPPEEPGGVANLDPYPALPPRRPTAGDAVQQAREAERP
jgi:antitoxin (DNA-binding transcriptional repressor) of toxin-antitoxin stability system